MTDLAPNNQPSGISLPVFILVAVMLVAGVMTAIWFAFPGPDNSHRLVSPSGTRVIELAELCGSNGCDRVAILDITQPDGTHARTGCPLAPSSLTPLFADVSTTWSESEDRVDITYVSASGPTGTLTLLMADCTLT